jgi:ATP-dependent Clp protease ATP-binding subunit ClpA
MIGPWYFRFFLIFLFIIVAKALPSLCWLMISVALCIVVIKLLYGTERLPGKIMDILDRLTNKPELERKHAAQAQQSLVIDAAELAAYMKTKIVGQDKVIDSVAQQLRRRIAARRKNKPVAVFCFAGPPSVGKTYFAKILAEKLYGDQKNLLFFDMAMYSQPHAVSSLFGQAKGYVGSNTYGTLTAGLRDFPRSVILLDEFEKAHPEAHKRFLTAWNDGFVTEVSDGARISTSDAIFILTTNAASKKLSDLTGRYGENHSEFSEAVKKVLQEETFAPEVLSRIDDFFAFNPLKGLDIARVVALEIERTVHQYQLELVEGGIDPAILLQAVEQEDKFHSDVRELARSVEHKIADTIIEAKTAGAKRISLRMRDGRIIALAENPGPPEDESIPAKTPAARTQEQA